MNLIKNPICMMRYLMLFAVFCSCHWLAECADLGNLLSASPLQSAQDETPDSRTDVRAPTRRDADFPINAELVLANGIGKTSGKYIDLYSDLRDEDTLSDLVKLFDSAVDFWRDYFSISSAKLQGWRAKAMVMVDKSRFLAAGLFPSDLPDFPAGYQVGDLVWLYVQPGEYYTRHLLLHEGTHAFMWRFLGGLGAPWYSEGMAEMLAIHRWDGGELLMNYKQARREELPYWGRVKLIRDAVAQQKMLTLEEVMAAEIANFRELNWYAWAWAACLFFDSHPKWSDTFKGLKKYADESAARTSTRFWRSMRSHHAELNREWSLFIQELDYGIETERMFVVPAEPAEEDTWTISAERGWHDTGLSIEPGETIDIVATGRFVIRRDTRTWYSEANGVTVEYVSGFPLGQLLAAVVQDDGAGIVWLSPQSVGAKASIASESAGKLYLKINDHPAERGDNEGALSVRIRVHR
ncbi:MAG TPA: hypothetical protein PKD64_03685 [Pirellulaceae bacterium]|nr:hypothetical protein [Pirellulaceae bacterium]HMO91272.1 hypothetical protein [Pirellulaceae bacterium]HMP68544.1 hypothetical protein [Pirellulaceae bacterium]